MQEAAEAQDKGTGSTFALARVQNAIALVDTRLARAEDYSSKKFKFKAGSTRSTGSSETGYAAGRRAGNRADLHGHKTKRIK